MLPKVMSPHPQPNFHAIHWLQRPAWQSQWHALDTHFGNGQSFLDTLQAWQADKNAPQQLFYSAFSEHAPELIDPQLQEVCFGLLPGVHRISLLNNQVHLNLFIGSIGSNIKETDLPADSMCIDSFLSCDARNIARLSKLGTNIRWSKVHSEAIAQLKACGFVLNTETSTAVFQPHWKIKNPLRNSNSLVDASCKKVIIIGAGLAGSAVAYSLAQRGWQVEVIDQHAQIGGGASALPAGIFATHVSPDNNVLSRITRDGVRATVHRASSLLKRGHEWDLSHLLEHRYSSKRELPSGDLWPQAGLDWTAEAQAFHKKGAGLEAENKALWHQVAGWIQTPAFVKAQLSHPQIVCTWGHQISKLVRQASEWHLLDDHNQRIAEANHVVIANAHACQTLLDVVFEMSSEVQALHKRPFIPITPLRGQVTYGPMNLLKQGLRDKLPQWPVNGHGSYIANLPDLQNISADPYWIVGSSFQRYELDTQIRTEDQTSNLNQWAELMPVWHDEILANVDISNAKGWAGVRAALPDRLPAVGAFQHPDFAGLQVCTGMGARGISWSVLCGELLAAQMNHEPLPMATSLAKLMAASRFG